MPRSRASSTGSSPSSAGATPSSSSARDFTDVATPTELAYNARIAANLGAPVLLVLTGREPDESRARTVAELRQVAELAIPQLAQAHASLLAVVVNRADPEALAQIVGGIGAGVPTWAIPEDPFLVAPTVGAIMAAVDGELSKGDPALAGPRGARRRRGGDVDGERAAAAASRARSSSSRATAARCSSRVLTAHASATFPSLAGIVLNGGFELSPVIDRLIAGLDHSLPIITTGLGTYATVQRIVQTRGRLTANSQRKVDTALALFERARGCRGAHRTRWARAPPTAVTPLMFEYTLLERARSQRRRIVLPEGDDDRILQAAGTLLAREVVRSHDPRRRGGGARPGGGPRRRHRAPRRS